MHSNNKNIFFYELTSRYKTTSCGWWLLFFSIITNFITKLLHLLLCFHRKRVSIFRGTLFFVKIALNMFAIITGSLSSCSNVVTQTVLFKCIWGQKIWLLIRYYMKENRKRESAYNMCDLQKCDKMIHTLKWYQIAAIWYEM